MLGRHGVMHDCHFARPGEQLDRLLRDAGGSALGFRHRSPLAAQRSRVLFGQASSLGVVAPEHGGAEFARQVVLCEISLRFEHWDYYWCRIGRAPATACSGSGAARSAHWPAPFGSADWFAGWLAAPDRR